MVRVTLDTNAYISALNFGGNPAAILRLTKAERIELTISDAILGEIGKVLRSDKFVWPEFRIDQAIKEIEKLSEHVEPKQRLDVVKEDPTDNRILECALAGKSEYLVTGDKHLLKVWQYQAAKIVTPADFVEIVAQQGRGRRRWIRRDFGALCHS